MTSDSTTVDLSFPLQGAASALPVDHGYPLYGALSRILPTLHEARWLGVHPLSGQPDGAGGLVLTKPQLRLRVPLDRMRDVLPLSGQRLTILERPFTIGAPTIHALTPSATLDARLVLIRLTQLPKNDGATDRPAFEAAFLAEAKRQLTALGIVDPVVSLRGSRSIEVKGQRIRGFSVRVGNLSAEGSLALQATGLGGKRTMGCGLFRPTRFSFDLRGAEA